MLGNGANGTQAMQAYSAATPNFATHKSSKDSEERTRGYLPIENYGMIGNLRTVALVGTDGGIDFMCYPKFDSPSVFARLLDKNKGGHFHIYPLDDKKRTKQQYLPSSNVLLTRFLSEQGVMHITDYMHLPDRKLPNKPLLPWLIRQVDIVSGKHTVRVEVFPAFDYARAGHTTVIEEYPAGRTAPLKYVKHADGSHSFVGEKRVVFTSSPTSAMPDPFTLDLRYVIWCPHHVESFPNPSDITFVVQQHEDMHGPGVWAEIPLQEGQQITFILRSPPSKPEEAETVVGARTISLDPPLNHTLLESLYKQTMGYWLSWISQSTYKGRWREQVHRSALAMKLLTYEPTGAVVAAPTFALPEEIGGGRNWDYRYTWIRDSAFTIYGFLRIGLTEEAEYFMKFIEARCNDLNPDGSLQIMYSIDGAKELVELELTHLEGYKGSKPVRIGNGAFDHLQLDIYGALLDAAYLYNKYRSPISYDLWVALRRLVNYVCDNWDRQDMSIWEVRGQQSHFLYSKVQCWVAVDRGLRLAEKRSLPCPDRQRWLSVRDQIYEEIMDKGWSKQNQCFVQSYESRDLAILDSAVLIMPLVFFIAPNDPRMLSTLKKIMQPPHRGGLLENNLVFRYDHSKFDDGVGGGDEGAFSMCKWRRRSWGQSNACTFWLVEALTRAGQRQPELLHKAHLMFEQMLTFGNHLGLFSEEVAKSGEALGNFPQAFTHLALISSAFNLDRVLSGAVVNGDH